jgi:hypothetical protein
MDEEQLAGLRHAAEYRDSPDGTVPYQAEDFPQGGAPRAHLNSEGEPCGCGQTPPQPGLIHYRPPVQLIGPRDRDILASEDQGQYYCVGADTGVLVAREGRPVYATLAEWQSFASAVPGAVYIPITGAKGSRKLGPLFGSLPFVDTQGAPDVVGRVIEVLGFLEKAAEMLGQRVGQLDQQLINGRLHEWELLARAADMIDPDRTQPLIYEEQLDWLSKWREVISR